MSESSPANRREFLQAKIAGQQSKQGDADTDRSSTAPSNIATGSANRQAAYLEQFTKKAMGCEFEILFNMHQYRQSGIATAAAFELIDAIESQMTVYREDSEVSEINRTASSEAIAVEKQLFHVLQLAIEIFEMTGGAFDITSGPLTKVWGFDQRSGKVPQQSQIDEALPRVSCKHLQLEETDQTIKFLKPGVQINLGGIGKGHALDRVSQLFRQRGIEDFIIHGGQSSVLAFGNSIELNDDSEPAPSGWRVGISHPTLPAVRLAELTLRNQALGTSGTARQGFFHQGKRYGHIIDPRSGWPTDHLLSSTVVANSAAQADALATAFFVMTLDQIEQVCTANPDLTAVLIVAGPRKGKPEIRTFGPLEGIVEFL